MVSDHCAACFIIIIITTITSLICRFVSRGSFLALSFHKGLTVKFSNFDYSSAVENDRPFACHSAPDLADKAQRDETQKEG